MGFTVYLSLGGIATGNIILAGLGLFSAGIYAFLFITLTNVILSRSRQEKQFRKLQELKNFIRKTLEDDGADINNVVLKDFMEKFMSYLDVLPEETNITPKNDKTKLGLTMANESYQILQNKVSSLEEEVNQLKSKLELLTNKGKSKKTISDLRKMVKNLFNQREESTKLKTE
ncbi:MAG: hypothetical protein KGI28_01525 [Thaumarchaeota archaeon]|nr:hypothetical protein [Nitrososphaerota archaeon]